ncbi:MAG: cysteine-rich small domain-containing protein [Lachnospiraceae bacterium]|nr:cysteine-rich small domain-containing protein [Lachnospiraceae bacterium]
MKENSAKYFSNQACQYYPCHKVEDAEEFNCLFCYCPLYVLGERCGGNFRYTDQGIKDCTNCSIPHHEGGYEYVMEHISKISDLVRKVN